MNIWKNKEIAQAVIAATIAVFAFSYGHDVLGTIAGIVMIVVLL